MSVSALSINWRTAFASRSHKSQGALARTVVPYLYEGDAVRRGSTHRHDPIGLQVDLRVPAEAYTSSIITAEDKDKEHPKGMHVMAGSTVVFQEKQEEEE